MAFERFDTIVLGTGAVGAAVLDQLAQRGQRVLGLDQYPPGHDRGSSHGQTRAIRRAYFEHPDYVPLLTRAYELWDELEERSGETLFERCGLLQVGPRTGDVVRGVLQSAREHDLEVELIEQPRGHELCEGFEVPEGLVAVHERDAGYLHVEACVRAQIELACLSGAAHRVEAVDSWFASRDGVEVMTRQSTYVAGSLVICAGAWSGPMLETGALDLPLQVLRKSLFWFAGETSQWKQRPVFLFELPFGVFYGFPALDEAGLKLAEHSGGLPVAGPHSSEHALEEDEARVQRFRKLCLPGLESSVSTRASCMYTMTPDQHFIVDRHPLWPHVAYAAGLSGHGFKMAAALGEALADLIDRGSTQLPIGFLSRDRLES